MIDDNRLPFKEKYLEYFSKAPFYRYAAAYVGKDENTILRWRKEDADFEERLNKAKSEYLMKGLEKVRSMEWKLERIFPDILSNKSEVTVNFADVIKKADKFVK